MQPKVICHDGTCFQCTGEAMVITIEAAPLPLSLCPSRLAFILSDATWIRSAIVKRWILVDRQAGERRGWRLEERERKAREDLDRVLKMDEGNGRGV